MEGIGTGDVCVDWLRECGEICKERYTWGMLRECIGNMGREVALMPQLVQMDWCDSMPPGVVVVV